MSKETSSASAPATTIPAPTTGYTAVVPLGDDLLARHRAAARRAGARLCGIGVALHPLAAIDAQGGVSQRLAAALAGDPTGLASGSVLTAVATVGLASALAWRLRVDAANRRWLLGASLLLPGVAGLRGGGLPAWLGAALVLAGAGLLRRA